RPELVAALQEGQIVVGPMGEPQLREVICGPARRAHVEVEEGLVDLILRDLAPAGAGDPAHDPGARPLLSPVLLARWQRGYPRRLTVADYAASGAIRGAVAQTAERVYAGLDDPEQELARRLFIRLVHAGEGVGETRRRVPHDELRGGDAVEDAAR